MKYLVKLRYYPGDALQAIRKEDLQALAAKESLAVGLENIEGEMTPKGEKTLDKDLETISQTVISLETDSEDSLKNSLREVIRTYRSPRTVFSLWGSNQEGEKVAWRVIEELDGWW
ncbi:hypothetical protein SAMN04489760_11944 [Syntrophus gentianae]|uniref:Uncharacterized protein n=1 Tax=Syntrophus gentianae TaxID=43775 RepID=A0A1H7Z0E8_9BACT|nr:hypothetical protein [Syntrophus gentianae]SEM51651.1 hypothetical protein SAMN04489760_11944 [Syntrophus gentianae]